MEGNFTAMDAFSAENVFSESKETTAAKPWSAAGFIRNFCNNPPKKSVLGKVAKQTKEWVVKMFKHFLKFLQQAVEIAISKFVVELCAMVIAAVSSAILNKHKKGIDITSESVYYGGQHQAPAAPSSGQPSQQTSWRGSVFDEGWGRSSGAW